MSLGLTLFCMRPITFKSEDFFPDKTITCSENRGSQWVSMSDQNFKFFQSSCYVNQSCKKCYFKILIPAFSFLWILVALILCLLCRNMQNLSLCFFQWHPQGTHFSCQFNVWCYALYCNSTQLGLYLFSLLIHSYFDWLILASHLSMTHISSPESVSGAKKIMLIRFQSLHWFQLLNNRKCSFSFQRQNACGF